MGLAEEEDDEAFAEAFLEDEDDDFFFEAVVALVDLLDDAFCCFFFFALLLLLLLLVRLALRPTLSLAFFSALAAASRSPLLATYALTMVMSSHLARELLGILCALQ